MEYVMHRPIVLDISKFKMPPKAHQLHTRVQTAQCTPKEAIQPRHGTAVVHPTTSKSMTKLYVMLMFLVKYVQ